VTIKGQTVQKASQKVKAYDLGSIELRPTPQSQAFKAESMALDMLYVDEHLMVINKPAGLVVHPAPGNWSGTLMNGLLGFDAQAFNLPRAGIVHRLDKDTSGLMVVARSRIVMDALVRAIAAREVKRQYVALAHGPWRGEAWREVQAPIGRDPANRLRMAVVDLATHAGKTARTDIELLANGSKGCLVKCTLHTGRTHQIRVHLASIAHPLVADLVYGGTVSAGMQRQALHAYRLAFMHPVTAQPLAFNADLPLDFSQALVQWGLQYNPG
jgi:23S rRNA pseudouridine1911/1915/1917 synthase